MDWETIIQNLVGAENCGLGSLSTPCKGGVRFLSLESEKIPKFGVYRYNIIVLEYSVRTIIAIPVGEVTSHMRFFTSLKSHRFKRSRALQRSALHSKLFFFCILHCQSAAPAARPRVSFVQLPD